MLTFVGMMEDACCEEPFRQLPAISKIGVW